MIGIILAGGYGRRLWPLTYDRPKVLLPLAKKTVLDHVFKKLDALNPPLRGIIISTNMKFQQQFEEWLSTRQYGNVELAPDQSRSEEEKPGAVAALAEIAQRIDDEMLVLAGDNLFTDGLGDLVDFYREKNAPAIALFYARSLDDLRRGSAVTIDSDLRIVEFVEKPTAPNSNIVASCVYVFPARIRGRLQEYIRLNLPRDHPGRFVEWLHKQENVYGYMLRDYLWDVGTPESYRATDEYFSRHVS